MSEKIEVLYAEINKIVEAATSSYSSTGYFLQYIYSELVLRFIRRSNQGVQLMNFPSQIFFNNVNHGYRAAILNKILCGCF